MQTASPTHRARDTMSITDTFRILPHRPAPVDDRAARRRWLAGTEPLRQAAEARCEQFPELSAVLRDGRLLTLIASIPPGLREVLVLRELEGLDDAATGRILGLDAMTVRVRLRAAHMALERRVLRHLRTDTK